MSDFVIKKGGKLFRLQYGKKQENVTEFSYRFLFEFCSLDKNVKLRDIFLLLNSNLKMYDTLFGNWCKEIVTNGLSKKCQIKKDAKMDFLELYVRLENNTFGEDSEKYISGIGFPSFHGVGVVKKKPKNDWDRKKGEVETYAVEFTPPYELAPYPLFIRNTTECITDTKKYREEPKIYHRPELTLGQILYGIIWELSWGGSPEQAQKMREELDKRVEEIKNGTAELIPFEDVIKNMKELIKKKKSK